MHDQDLWEQFRVDFEVWKPEHFKNTDRDPQTDLRNFLRSNGVYIPSSRQLKIYNELAKVLTEDPMHQWTKEEVLEVQNQCKDLKVELNSNWVDFYNPPNPPPPPPLRIKKAQKKEENEEEEGEEEPDPTPTPRQRGEPLYNKRDNPGHTPHNTKKRAVVNGGGDDPSDDGDDESFHSAHDKSIRDGRTKIPYTNGNNFAEGFKEYMENYTDDLKFGQQMANLRKSYSEELKYSGAEDFLDVKVHTFYTLASQASIPPLRLKEAISAMLTGPALNYYYRRIAGHSYTLLEVMNILKANFETEQRSQQLLDEWHALKLRKIMNDPKNSGKTNLECFDILVQRFQVLQDGLPYEFHNDRSIRDRVIGACEGVRECQLAVIDRPKWFDEVVAKIKNALGTTNKIAEEESGTSATFMTEAIAEAIVLYTDRNFKGKNQGRGGGSFRRNNWQKK